jgi:hypothetical protein
MTEDQEWLGFKICVGVILGGIILLAIDHIVNIIP